MSALPEDPYAEWARAGQVAAQPVTSPDQVDPALLPPGLAPVIPLEHMYPHAQDAIAAAAPVVAPAPPVVAAPGPPGGGLIPGIGVPSALVDPYVASMGGANVPVTSPHDLPLNGGAAPKGPIESPADSPPGTARPNAYGGTDVFGGDVAPADRAQALERMTPAQQAAAVDSMTPDEFQRYKATRERAMVMRQAELEHKAAADDLQRARDNLALQQRASAKATADTQDLLARADRLAATKIDPQRYAKGRSAIGDILLSAIGGAVSQYTGGRNLFLDQFNKNVENDIAAQHADIANGWRGLDTRKGAIASEYANHGDLYRAQETYRIAAYKSAIDGLQGELQQYDPAGGTAVHIRSTLDQFHAAQQQAIQAFGQQQFKNYIESQKSQSEAAAQLETARHNRAGESIDWAKIAGEKAKAKATEPLYSPEYLQSTLGGTVKPPGPMSVKEYGAFLETSKKAQEQELGGREYTIGGVAKAVRDRDGNIVDTNYKPLTNKDGTEFHAPSTKEAENLRTQKAGVDVVNQFVDQMAEGIKEHGGESAFFKSSDWQRMMADKESLLFGLHSAYGVEGFRPGVLEQMEKALGGADPTSFFRNATSGLLEAKKLVNKHFDAKLRAASYTGETYSPEPAPALGGPLADLTEKTAAEIGADAEPGAVGRGVDRIFYPAGPPDRESAAFEGAAGESGPTGLSPKATQQVIDLAKRYATGTPATRERVINTLAVPLAGGRESLAWGVLSLLRGENHELYQEVLKTAPPEIQAQAASSAKLGVGK